jgi:hypothetical protein
LLEPGLNELLVGEGDENPEDRWRPALLLFPKVLNVDLVLLLLLFESKLQKLLLGFVAGFLFQPLS